MSFQDWINLSALLRAIAYLILLVYIVRSRRFWGLPVILILIFGAYASTTPTNVDNFYTGLLFTPLLIFAVIKNEEP